MCATATTTTTATRISDHCRHPEIAIIEHERIFRRWPKSKTILTNSNLTPPRPPQQCIRVVRNFSRRTKPWKKRTVRAAIFHCVSNSVVVSAGIICIIYFGRQIIIRNRGACMCTIRSNTGGGRFRRITMDRRDVRCDSRDRNRIYSAIKGQRARVGFVRGFFVFFFLLVGERRVDHSIARNILIYIYITLGIICDVCVCLYTYIYIRSKSTKPALENSAKRKIK